MDHRDAFDCDALAAVSVENDPPQLLEGTLDAEDLELMQRYIALNRTAIIDHWNGETDGAELLQALRPSAP